MHRLFVSHDFMNMKCGDWLQNEMYDMCLLRKLKLQAKTDSIHKTKKTHMFYTYRRSIITHGKVKI